MALLSVQSVAQQPTNNIQTTTKSISNVLEQVPRELQKEVQTGLLKVKTTKDPALGLKQSFVDTQADPFWRVLIDTGSIPTTGVLPEAFMKVDFSSDQENNGKNFLWNLNALWWTTPYVESHLLAEVKVGSSSIKNYYLKHSKAYPVRVDSEHTSEQLFSERLKLEFPTHVQGFSWLRFRFRGGDSDMLWYQSALLGKSRQLTSANTGDNLLTLSVSLDDLNLWNAKPEQFQVQYEVLTDPLLVPVVNDRIIQVSGSKSDCTHVRLRSHKQLSNALDVGIPDESGWPYVFEDSTMAVGYQRAQLVKVVLNNSDPYSLYARQVLYLDMNSMLPYYSFVYNRRGQLWKSLVGFFINPTKGITTSVRPRLLFLYVRDHQKRSTTLLTWYRQSLCQKLSALQQAELSPLDLEPKVEPSLNPS